MRKYCNNYIGDSLEEKGTEYKITGVKIEGNNLCLTCDSDEAFFEYTLFGKDLYNKFMQEAGVTLTKQLIGKEIIAFESSCPIPKRANADPVCSISGISIKKK